MSCQGSCVQGTAYPVLLAGAESDPSKGRAVPVRLGSGTLMTPASVGGGVTFGAPVVSDVTLTGGKKPSRTETA